jgi:hypothetical protein
MTKIRTKLYILFFFTSIFFSFFWGGGGGGTMAHPGPTLGPSLHETTNLKYAGLAKPLKNEWLN